MIALGLGSNIGDRVHHLTRAFRKLIDRKLIYSPIRVSSAYESPALRPVGAPESWNLPFLNFVLVAETKLSPEEFLKEVKRIESELGRKKRERWAPREIDIDLIWSSNGSVQSEELQLPHPEFQKRDFVMLPLKELFPEDPRFQIPFVDSQCKKLNFQILPVEMVGVLNFTPDSFSDGGRFFDLERGLQQISELQKSGAHLIDIGAESTRPGAEVLSSEQEWTRLEPLLKSLPVGIRWSLDSRHPETMKRALEFGLCQLNDVSGLASKQTLKIAKESQKPIVVMHNLGIPADREKTISNDLDPVTAVKDFFQTKIKELVSAGIDPEKIIFDPGLGFGKTAQQSAEILSRVAELNLDAQSSLYIGHSRKSLFNLVSQLEFKDRDLETAVVSARLIHEPIHFVRVHNIEMTKRAIRTELLVGRKVH